MIMPDDLAKSGTEHGHQSALFCWASLPEQQKLYPELKWMFAIPNGGKRDMVTASNLKAEGVKPGVPDIMLPIAKRGFHGLFIEMKKPVVGRVSVKQSDFAVALMSNKYHVITCYGWVEARDVIVAYLALDNMY